MEAFNWDTNRELAAQLLADGTLTDQEIADRISTSRMTLWRWRQHPEFTTRIEEHRDVFRAEVRRRGIADRERRIKALNDRWNRLQRVMEERADDPSMADVPGGRTGLLVHNVKSVGFGETAQIVDLYEIDVGMLKELREHEKQAAQELGQWVEQSKVEQTTKAYVTVSPDDL